MKWFLVLAAAVLFWAQGAFGYTGACAIWYHKAGEFISQNKPGTQAGFDAAKAAVGQKGSIFIYGGCEGQITIGTLPDSVMVFTYDSAKWVAYSKAASIRDRSGQARLDVDSLGIRVTGKAVVSDSLRAPRLLISDSLRTPIGLFSDSLRARKILVQDSIRTPRVMATNGIISRLGPASVAGSGAAIRIVDGVTFAQTAAGIQAAIDDLPASGGTVLIPAGVYTGTATIYTPCDRPVHLVGSGKHGGAALGTLIKNTADADVLVLRGDFSSVSNLSIAGTGTVAASNEESRRGIVVGRRNLADRYTGGVNEITQAGGGTTDYISISDVHIFNTGGWGLFWAGNAKLSDETTDETGKSGTTLSIWCAANRVTVSSPLKYGALYIGGGCTTTSFRDCDFGVGTGRGGNDAYYAHLGITGSITFDGCTFEGYQPGSKPWVRLYYSAQTRFYGCWWEHDPGETPVAAPSYFVDISSGSYATTFDTCKFNRSSSTLTGYVRVLTQSTAYGTTISNCYASTTSEAYPGGTATDAAQYSFHADARGVQILGGFHILNGGDGLFHQPTIANRPDRLTMLTDRGLKIASWAKSNKNAGPFEPFSLVWVWDASAGHQLQFFDGTNWYYITLTAITGGGTD